MKKFNDRLKRLREHSEDGAALLSVVIVSMFVFIVIASISTTTLYSTILTADDRSNVLVVSSAESGQDAAVGATTMGECVPEVEDENFTYKVYRSAADSTPSGLDDTRVSEGCPIDGDNYVIVVSHGTDARGKEITITGTYLWLKKPVGTSNGALVSGGGSMNISTLSITSEGGDLMLSYGDFDCNSSSSISGDLVIIDGSVSFSNACYIGGSLYSSGNVVINNNAVGVGGDVYALGNFSMSTAATVYGSVYSNGNLNLTSNSKINGDVVSTGTGNQLVGAVTIGGDLRVAGKLDLQTNSHIKGSVFSATTQTIGAYNTKIDKDFTLNGGITIQASQIGRNFLSSYAGNSALNPTLPIGGNLVLAGTYSTYGAGPTVAGTITQHGVVTPAPTPRFDVPEQLLPGYFKWKDFNYIESAWLSAGYQILERNVCNYQNSPAAVAEINALTTPTLIDIRSCSNVQMYGVVFNLKTDVTFLGNGFYAHSLKANSATGNPISFNFMIPDTVNDGTPTCVAGQGEMNIYALKLGTNVTGFNYSPCKVSIGGLSTITGQVYAGTVAWSGGGLTTLDYRMIALPGFPVDDATGPGASGYEEIADQRPRPLLVSRSETH